MAYFQDTQFACQNFDRKGRLRIVLRWLRHLLVAGLLLWGAGINFFLMTYCICQECIPLVEQLANGTHFLLLISVLAFAVTLLFSPRWWLITWILPGVMMFGVWYGPQMIPRAEPEIEGTEIKVATYNTLSGVVAPDDTLRVIEVMDVDIVGLHEVGFQLAGRLRVDLRQEYPYQVLPSGHKNDFFALLSRYPVLEHSFYFEPPDEENGRPFMRYVRAVLDIEGHETVVYLFHPNIPQVTPLFRYDDEANEAQTQRMVELLEEEGDRRVMLLCDCNTTPRSEQYRMLDGVLDEAFGEVGQGFGLTFSLHRFTNWPLFSEELFSIRIDYIWYSEQFTALDAEVWPVSGLSDHRPLVARLDLRE